MTRWLDPTPIAPPASLDALKFHPLITSTLFRRGLTDPDVILAFLHPEEQPAIPYPEHENHAVGGIGTAIERLKRAVLKGETICVWGDFDVDGQTSTALLVQTLRAMRGNVVYYIPIRGRESHGLHVASLDPILDAGTSLVLTCDTGITAHQAVDHANTRGVDVIITDHHEPGGTLPNAKAVINPKLLPLVHPLSSLAGVGVAYKLAEALLDSEPQCADLLDLVALGSIADVALLQGETRSLTHRGIQSLRQGKRPGLKVIAELAGVNLDTLTEETIGFTYAPRLNALGRLGDANPAVELLLTQDNARARVLAAQIEGLNTRRRLLTTQVYEAAQSQLNAEPDLLREPAIILSHPNWPAGVVGIVANKLVERHHKPAILLTDTGDGILRGSARSVEGLNITQAIASQKELLLGFGGHPMAAGLSLPVEKLAEFQRGLGRAIEAQLGVIVREEPVLQVDAWLGLDEINISLAEAIETLAPFGAGNPPLTFATRQAALKAVRVIGGTREHLRLNIEDEHGNSQSILWWGGADEVLPQEGDRFDIAYSLRAGTYRGQKQLSLNFADYRITEAAPAEITTRQIEVIDRRLQGRLEDLDRDTLIWAEGADGSKGKTRYALVPSTAFAIYTAPPSPFELRQALELVKPEKVFIFCVPPDEGRAEDFIKRLAGLCKYAINQRGGKASLPELAAALAARERAVEIGLQWLAASGQFVVAVEDDQAVLSRGNNDRNPYLQAELLTTLRGILDETSAYRKFVRTISDLKTIL